MKFLQCYREGDVCRLYNEWWADRRAPRLELTVTLTQRVVNIINHMPMSERLYKFHPKGYHADRSSLNISKAKVLEK